MASRTYQCRNPPRRGRTSFALQAIHISASHVTSLLPELCRLFLLRLPLGLLDFYPLSFGRRHLCSIHHWLRLISLDSTTRVIGIEHCFVVTLCTLLGTLLHKASNVAWNGDLSNGLDILRSLRKASEAEGIEKEPHGTDPLKTVTKTRTSLSLA